LSYLLDTNTWIALLRWQNIEVLSHLKQHPAEEIVTCSVVLAELWYGAERSDANRRAGNYTLIDDLESKYQSLPFDNNAAREYARIRAYLSNLGQPIGPNDTMIAAIARSFGVTLVTENTAEFHRVPGLVVEDWQTP
jgi:tRNA(fMet)-specific endonuclease VapC